MSKDRRPGNSGRNVNTGNTANTANKNKGQRRLALVILCVLLTLAACWILLSPVGSDGTGGSEHTAGNLELRNGTLPEWSGSNYVTVNGNVPDFPDNVYGEAGLNEDGTGVIETYEHYGQLDDLGRCTEAYGCLGLETMPADGEERGDISAIHPTGWVRSQGWERCHLIAWALGAENANERNLVTGTHYLNYDGMRPAEEDVEHYIWKTGNHVLYMAKPFYEGDELVARGIQMMARSVEDGGKGISFNIYCFNVTPGSEINYSTGVVTTAEQASRAARLYVVNKRSGVFHYPSCEGAREISRRNRMEVTATRSELTEQGYIPCGYCEP